MIQFGEDADVRTESNEDLTNAGVDKEEENVYDE